MKSTRTTEINSSHKQSRKFLTSMYLVLLIIALGTFFSIVSLVYEAFHGVPSGVSPNAYFTIARQSETQRFERLSLVEMEYLDENLNNTDLFFLADWLPQDVEIMGRKYNGSILRGVSQNFFRILGATGKYRQLQNFDSLDTVAVVSSSFYERLGISTTNPDTLPIIKLQSELLIPIIDVAEERFNGLNSIENVDIWIINPTPKCDPSLYVLPGDFADIVYRQTMSGYVYGILHDNGLQEIKTIVSEYRFNEGVSGLPIETGAAESDRIVVYRGLVGNLNLQEVVQAKILQLGISTAFIFPLIVALVLYSVSYSLAKRERHLIISIVTGANIRHLILMFFRRQFALYVLCAIASVLIGLIFIDYIISIGRCDKYDESHFLARFTHL